MSAVGRSGNQFAQYSKLLEYVVHHWFSPTSDSNRESFLKTRKPCLEYPAVDKLSAIPFDKLGNLVGRIWTTAYEISCPGASGDREEEIESSDEVVRRPCPLGVCRGLHGEGRFLKSEDGIEYLIDVVHKIQTLTRKKRFDIFAVKGDNGRLSSDPKGYIRPAAIHANPGIILTGFNSYERQTAAEIASVVAHLSPGEIRALGTHSTRSSLRRDLQFEFRLILGQLKAVQRASIMAIAAWEIVRKSDLNRDDYESGRTKLLSIIRDQKLREALEVTHEDSTTIWEEPYVSNVRSKARKIHVLALSCLGKDHRDYNTQEEESFKTAGLVLARGSRGSEEQLEEFCKEFLRNN